MRWVLLLMTLLSWGLCFTRHGAGVMAWWLFAGIVGVIVTAMAFVQARIDANARPEIVPELMKPRGDHHTPPQP